MYQQVEVEPVEDLWVSLARIMREMLEGRTTGRQELATEILHDQDLDRGVSLVDLDLALSILRVVGDEVVEDLQSPSQIRLYHLWSNLDMRRRAIQRVRRR